MAAYSFTEKMEAFRGKQSQLLLGHLPATRVDPPVSTQDEPLLWTQVPSLSETRLLLASLSFPELFILILYAVVSLYLFKQARDDSPLKIRL